MKPRENYFAYFEDLAKRNKSIDHRPASETTTRFYIQEAIDRLASGAKPDTTGWVMLVGPFHGNGEDKGGNQVLKPRVIMKVIKHCAQGDYPAAQSTTNEAWDIGWEIIQMIRQHRDQCMEGMDAAITHLSAGIAHPRSLDLTNVGFDEVGPEFDNHFGYVFTFNLLVDRDVPTTITAGNWQDPQ